MGLSGLDIYKLLPKTNCKDCGFATCLAFAMQLAKKMASIESCPHISPQSKEKLEAQAMPPIKLVTIGSGDNKFEIGNETVMFRHEEKFHHPSGIGFLIDDSVPEGTFAAMIEGAKKMRFERIGELLKLDFIALRQTKDTASFVRLVEKTSATCSLALIIMPADIEAARRSLEILKGKRPLLFPQKNDENFALLAEEFSVPLVVQDEKLENISVKTEALAAKGFKDIILCTGNKPLRQKLLDFTQLRRQALKKNNRDLGYPLLAEVENTGDITEPVETALYILKYAGIVILKGFQPWEILPLLALRQSIFTDPQKPLQVEPKLYEIGAVTGNSPVMITTNFSLSYYTVLTEVEASKVPSFIIAADTEGMSVLTAWAAEKFSAQHIAAAVKKLIDTSRLTHRKLIIPGYIAVVKADLEDALEGWEIIVGPKEASGLPSFLKNM